MPYYSTSLMGPDKLSGFRSSLGHLISYSFGLSLVLTVLKCNLIRNGSLRLHWVCMCLCGMLHVGHKLRKRLYEVLQRLSNKRKK